MIWIFSRVISYLGILLYNILLNGLVGCIVFQLWKRFEKSWKNKGAYTLLYGLLKIVILMFLIPFCWTYVTFQNYDFHTGFRYNDYPWPLDNYRMTALFLGPILIWLWAMARSVRKYAKEKHHLKTLKFLGQKLEKEELNAVYSVVPPKLVPRKKIPVVVCPGLASPMVAGLFQTCIYIPRRDYDPDTLGLILSHELTHVSHQDLFFKNLCAAITIVYWFCPFLQEMFWKYDCWSEVLCDLKLCDGKQAAWSAKAYYSVLLKEIEKTGTQDLKMCSGLYETEKTIKWRVESMKNYHMMKEQSKALAFLLAALFLFGCPLAVTASGNAAVKGLSKVYDQTLIHIEETEESQEQYRDPSLEQYGTLDENEEIIILPKNPEERSGGFTTTEIPAGARTIFSEAELTKGESVNLSVTILSGNGPVEIGIVKDQTTRSVSFSSKGNHIFDIDVAGMYKIFVKNKGTDTVTIEFFYSY
ncbi:MAG: M56 family metallopeptidase [Lachnospiraceae bacterium]|nr:M56 family metallopeptidase [Lachnospiraceae bacterium]